MFHPDPPQSVFPFYKEKIHSMSLRTNFHYYSTIQEHNYQTESGFPYKDISLLVSVKYRLLLLMSVKKGRNLNITKGNVNFV